MTHEAAAGRDHLVAVGQSMRERAFAQKVRFTPHSEDTFLIGRRAGGDSAKTYEFSARGACVEKRMSFRITTALIGGFSPIAENG
jgi:hypothetical protein